MEAFSDGTVIKEAFILFYFFLIMALIINSIKIQHQMAYVVRSIILCLGSTIFCVRLLINRLAKHWLPEWTYRGIIQVYMYVHIYIDI
jgi:hypothetical protein